jgi:hypothetical protein
MIRDTFLLSVMVYRGTFVVEVYQPEKDEDHAKVWEPIPESAACLGHARHATLEEAVARAISKMVTDTGGET